MSWLVVAPLPLIGAIVMALLFAAMEGGYRGHGWLRRRQGTAQAAQVAPDHLLSAMLGLLALLLGFTFSLALNRYEARRDLVVQEANAIGTAWLRAGLLEEPARTEIGGLLKRYVDVRLAWSLDPAVTPSLTATTALQNQLWTATGSAVRHDSSAQLSRGLMDAMNQSFDLASARAAGRAAHIPEEVLGILLLCAILTAAMLGYIMGASAKRHRTAAAMLLLLLSLALVLIFDLDRPVSGSIQISQQPLEQLAASIHS